MIFTKCSLCDKKYLLQKNLNKHILNIHSTSINNLSTKLQIEKNTNTENAYVAKIDKSNICVICMVKEKTTAFFRCGHKVCCLTCAKIVKDNVKTV